MSPAEIAAHLLFESLRIKNQKEQLDLFKAASRRLITEDAFVEAQEKLALKYAMEHHELVREAVMQKKSR
jgi:hypothetical protein